MTKIFLTIGLLCVASTAVAQQEGSVAIAKAIVPAPETLLTGFNECVKVQMDLGAENIEQANKACSKNMKRASNASKEIAEQARHATKASRPVVVGGWGYGGGYAYGYAPRRPLPPQRPLPPPRRW